MTRQKQYDALAQQGAYLDTYSPPAPMQHETGGMNQHEYLPALYRRRWIILATIITVFTVGMLYMKTKRPVYESVAKLAIVTGDAGLATSENDVPLLSDLRALTRNRSMDTQVELMSSPALLRDAFGRLSKTMRLKGYGKNKLPPWGFKIAPKKESDVIMIIGRAHDPAVAAVLANNIADGYFRRGLRVNSLATRQSRKRTQESIVALERELALANVDLSQYKQQSGFFAPETQLTKSAEQIAQMSMDVNSTKAELASMRRGVDALRRELSNEKQDVVGNTTLESNPQFREIVAKIDTLNSERASLLQEFQPDAIEIRTIDSRIKDERERLKKVAATIVSSKVHTRNPIRDSLLTRYAGDVSALAATSARYYALENELSSLKQAAQKLPERQRMYTEKLQLVELLQRKYDALSNKYNALLLSEQTMLPNGILISRAEKSEKPAYPNMKSSVILFILLGVMMGVAIALVMERLDSRVRDESVINSISGLTALSVVPDTRNNSPQLLGNNSSNNALLESFRILRNNIHSSILDQQLKIIAITSPGRGDGKSTTTLNLAAAMAIEGKSVLVVDCDIRRPSLHKVIGVRRNPGLTSVITQDSRLEDTIVATQDKNVFFLPAGPPNPNPAEILNSQTCRMLLKKMSEQYDVVLMDCPPTVGLSDIQIVSTIADGVLLVVSINQTLRPHLDMTLRSLAQAEAPVIGVVLNRMNIHKRGYGYYDYCASDE